MAVPVGRRACLLNELLDDIHKCHNANHTIRFGILHSRHLRPCTPELIECFVQRLHASQDKQWFCNDDKYLSKQNTRERREREIAERNTLLQA